VLSLEPEAGLLALRTPRGDGRMAETALLLWGWNSFSSGVGGATGLARNGFAGDGRPHPGISPYDPARLSHQPKQRLMGVMLAPGRRLRVPGGTDPRPLRPGSGPCLMG